MEHWQKYAIDHFRAKPFFEVPPEFLEWHDGALKRFCSLTEFEHDTLVRYGCIAATCLSILFKPKVIVEFGVKAGWTSLLLSRLNPQAEVHGVDLSGCIQDTPLPTGYGALMNNCQNYHLHLMNSYDFDLEGKVDLCFIDADHALPAVLLDTERAWKNRNEKGEWCIAWDDYHPNNRDVLDTVNKFVEIVRHPLQKIGSWYWIGSKTMSESELAHINPQAVEFGE